MKVLFYTNVPSPYRVDFFNELGKYCDLTVLFELDSSTERNEEWKKFKFENFKGIILKGIRLKTDMAFCPNIIKYLNKRKYDRIIISVLASPTAFVAVSVMKMKKIPYIFEGDGGFPQNSKGMKAFLKRYIISNADKCFSTSKTFDEYCKQFGAKEDNIRRYIFTSLKASDILNNCLLKEEKNVLREELGIKEQTIILSVGRFTYGNGYGKGFDLLIKSCAGKREDAGIYIIGGTETEKYEELQEEYGVENVHYLDYMNFQMLKKYFQLADIFVLFTRGDVWGLVINEAMSQGLPVISTDRCGAALELVENGVNGYIVKSENVEEINTAFEKMLKSEDIYEAMGKASLEKIRKYTIENMAKEHLELLTEDTKNV